jgi:hypothetical protein
MVLSRRRVERVSDVRRGGIFDGPEKKNRFRFSKLIDSHSYSGALTSFSFAVN